MVGLHLGRVRRYIGGISEPLANSGRIRAYTKAQIKPLKGSQGPKGLSPWDCLGEIGDTAEDQSYTLNPKPHTLNPKSYTLNSEP